MPLDPVDVHGRVHSFVFHYLLCRACIERALCSEQANCPLCHIPAWVKDVKSDRQMATLIKLVATMSDQITSADESEGNACGHCTLNSVYKLTCGTISERWGVIFKVVVQPFTNQTVIIKT